jgi:hypothetical protein
MKKYLLNSLVFAFILILTLSGCGGGSGAPNAPTAPSALKAVGSLGNIHLSWNASTGEGLVGYNVYRSVNGSGSFTKLNGSPITSTSYDNPIDSPAGDGVLYYYKVTAVGNAESAASNTVKSMHGTRLAASYSGGFTTQASNSPYVAEGITVVNGGNLAVASGTKLYILDNSTIDLEVGNGFVVSGLLRTAVTSGAAHATFATHKTVGVLDEGEGFYFEFYGAVNYNPSDDSGTMLRYVQINLGSTGASINFCGIKLDNVRITSNVSNGNSLLNIANDGWAIIQNCYFEKSLVRIGTDLRTSLFQMKRNIFHDCYNSIYFNGLSNPGVNPGQIEQNDFDGSKSAMLYNMTGGSNVPLGNNYWNGGTGNPPVPTVAKVGTSIDFDFSNPSAPLSSSPSGVGPNW